MKLAWIFAEGEITLVSVAIAAVSDEPVAVLAMGAALVITTSGALLILRRSWLKSYL